MTSPVATTSSDRAARSRTLSGTSRRDQLFRGMLTACALSIPALLIFSPLIYLILVLLDLNAISVTVVAILLALFLSVAAPVFVHLANPWRWTVPILLAGAGSHSVPEWLEER